METVVLIASVIIFILVIRTLVKDFLDFRRGR